MDRVVFLHFEPPQHRFHVGVSSLPSLLSVDGQPMISLSQELGDMDTQNVELPGDSELFT